MGKPINYHSMYKYTIVVYYRNTYNAQNLI